MSARDQHASDDPQRVPRITFASTPADPASYLPAEPSPPRFMLRLTPNGAPPLASSRAALDRALVIFTITDTATTPEHIAAHIIGALELNGRVHVTLEPMIGDEPRGGTGPRGNSNPSGLNTYAGRAEPSGEALAANHWWWFA